MRSLMAHFRAQELSLPLTTSTLSIFLAAHHGCSLGETTSDDLRANKRRGSHTAHLLPRVEPLISGVAKSMPARLYALKLHPRHRKSGMHWTYPSLEVLASCRQTVSMLLT